MIGHCRQRDTVSHSSRSTSPAINKPGSFFVNPSSICVDSISIRCSFILLSLWNNVYHSYHTTSTTLKVITQVQTRGIRHYTQTYIFLKEFVVFAIARIIQDMHWVNIWLLANHCCLIITVLSLLYLIQYTDFPSADHTRPLSYEDRITLSL